MIKLKESPSLVLYLGRQGENGVRTLNFDFSDFRERFGDGVLSLVMRRKVTEDPYPIALDIIPQSIAVWTVSNVETDIVGSGEAQFIYTVGGNVKKTVIYKTRVDASLTPVSETAPEAFQNWLDRLAEIGGQISTDKSVALEEIESAEAEALQAIGLDKSNALQAISDSRSGALQAISVDLANAIQDIRTDKTDAIETIQTNKINALNAISDSRLSALDAIDAEKESALQDMGDLVDDAWGYSESARVSSEDAEGFAGDAERYARQAESYAENLHFTDTGAGNIKITIGGTNG